MKTLPLFEEAFWHLTTWVCALLFCVGSSLLREDFLSLWQVRAILRCGAWASHCSGFSCCGAQALERSLSVVGNGLICLRACAVFLD